MVSVMPDVRRSQSAILLKWLPENTHQAGSGGDMAWGQLQLERVLHRGPPEHDASRSPWRDWQACCQHSLSSKLSPADGGHGGSFSPDETMAVHRKMPHEHEIGFLLRKNETSGL
ncbi:hypothetical protein EYF80_018231 [Liparis tanakae]|uniref:Uncharacterized protein n=1 Tax=Liparis tanakae TaxID=230148 RepID=A0A4Z2I245_9TELE|nr:hypothetical protein EYF80_018231 [Liparis tanakae]